MTRKRIAWIGSGTAAGLIAIAISAVMVLRSDWFFQKVREGVISTVETATGGKAELRDFRFDWRQLRVEIDGFVLHGREPAGKPPLFRASTITIGLKIISLFSRDVDIQSADVSGPHVYLIVYPDGSTNVPAPKVKRHAERSPIETLVNLAVGRFSANNGVFEMEDRGMTPFNLEGRLLDIKLGFEPAAGRYHGGIFVQPLELQWSAHGAVPLSVQMAVALEKDRIAIDSARCTTGGSEVEFTGTIENLAEPRVAVHYKTNTRLTDAARLLAVRGIESGTVQSEGNFQWTGPSDYTLDGTWNAYGAALRQDALRVQGIRADGGIRAGPQGANVSRLRFSSTISYTGRSVPVEGRVASVALRQSGLAFRGASLMFLGGSFTGDGALPAWRRVEAKGEIISLEAQRAVALYNPSEPLPWNSLVSGPVTLEATLGRTPAVQVDTKLTLSPAPTGPPVHGLIDARYDSATRAVDLGPSTLSLPSSNATVSGSLGHELRVHLDSRDLNDFLPVLGKNAANLPVKLAGGSLVFDGTMNGQVQDPQIAGRLRLARFALSGEPFDSFEAQVTASPRNAGAQNAVVTRGALRAQFQGSLGLNQWQPNGQSPLTVSGSLRNAGIAELLRLARRTDIPASGSLSLTGQIAGTVDNPQGSADFEAVKGAFGSEPFDRIAAHLNYTGNVLSASAGQATAPGKQVRFDGSFTHAPGRFDTGRLRFQLSTNSIALERIQTLEKARPGIKGNLQVTAGGAAEITPAAFRPIDLQAEVNGRALAFEGQGLGNARLTAQSAGPVLRVELQSDFANSMVQGQGEWRLEGKYPGSARIVFSRLDLARLRDWISPGQPGIPSQFSGAAEGELHIEGPALEPQAMQAELRLPSVELGPLRNSGPVVARMASSTVTLESARFTGPSTDLSATGRILLERQNPLDLHVSGKVDLGILKEFDRAITSSGAVTLEAGVRGTLNSPQVNGRLEVQGGTVNDPNFPNGISNAKGVIIFSGDRATIQSLSGETGGGRIDLSGFAGYTAGQAIFRIHADVKGVRVRYPEGVSTVADANLNLTGTTDRSLIAGTITVLRTGLNLQSDFGSVLAQSVEPVSTPPARTGFLGGLNFDVAIATSPDIQFESSLTQGVEAAATLRLRGTASNPALLGRINVTQGQVIFFGSRYTITQGSLSFYNPVKIEPILDVDLDTKARGIDITLNVSGPLNRPKVTPRSDPPLQLDQIFSLLTTGTAPSQRQALLSQQGANPQLSQQSSATALLGQVIANPVSGRLQRFFGISKLRIDPTLPGVQYNPQARITLEQQVTPELTFTYITNVTSANPQVVSVEWSVSKQWSVVAQREENGLFGLDFFYKKRFK